MKRVTTLSISILIIAIAGFFFPSYAAQSKKTTIKPVNVKTVTPPKPSTKGKKPSSKDTSKKSLKQILQQPDLVVEALRLKGGFIAFTLKNTGPGLLSDDDHKQGRVVISYKGFKKSYSLKTIDPTGKLQKPGGSVPCITRAMLTSRQDVTVVVAYGKNKKNILTRSLGKTPPRRIAKPGKKPGLKDISEAPAKQKKALKTPSKKDKASARSMAEPLISIAKVFQKDGNVRIVVRNNGRGRLSTRDYMQGKVRLNIGGKTRSWSLKKIDPTGRLGRYGGEVEFDTGISLKQKERVKVSIEKVKGYPVKIVNLAPRKSPSTSVAVGPRRTKSPERARTDLLRTKKIDLLPKASHYIDPGIHYIDPEKLQHAELKIPGLDLRIKNAADAVTYHSSSGPGRYVLIYFECDPDLYRGPIEFHIRLWDDENNNIVNEIFICPDSAVQYATFGFDWGHYSNHLRIFYSVDIDPNHKIPEIDPNLYRNNHRNGQLYRDNGPVHFMSGIRITGTGDFYGYYEFSDGGTFYLTEGAVKDAIQYGTWWYFDRYDPNCNTVVMPIEIKIGNPRCDEITQRIYIYWVEYDGFRQSIREVNLFPGEEVWVSFDRSFNLQEHNFIQLVIPGKDAIKVNLTFHGLPYDLD